MTTLETSLPEKPLAVPRLGGAAATAGRESAHSEVTLGAVVQWGVIAGQLAMFLYVIKVFKIESIPFRWTSALVVAGFLVHHWLPRRAQLPFFVVISVAALGVALGGVNATLPVAVLNTVLLLVPGLALIGAWHVPGPAALRWALVAILVGVLALVRAEVIRVPFFDSVLTLLGAMFMFRFIVYAYDTRKGAPVGIWKAMAYFFMVPGACFPLFPIVDYRTMWNTYFSESPMRLYQKGVNWILRGVIHLLLQRLINLNFSIDVPEVTDAGTLLQYILVAFGGYLKVSGTFHIIVGMLHLFGFNLPETHHRFLLSSSITDFWRRINIYWKDFIQKIIFYPLYFRLKKLGPNRAMIVTTALAMIITWAFHSYQWFWLKGVVLISPQDVLFWGVLGALLTVNTWYETRFARERALARARPTARRLVLSALKTMLTVGFLLVLWSMWLSESLSVWASMMAKGLNCSASNALLIAAFFAVLGLLAALEQRFAAPTTAKSLARGQAPGWTWRAAIPATLTLLVLAAVSRPQINEKLGSPLSRKINGVLTPRLTRAEMRLLEHGYYENLTNVARLNPQLAQLYAEKPPDWDANLPTQKTTDWRQNEVKPSLHMRFAGAMLSTNRFGMRDRDYELAKPPGVFRIGLFGESHSMGMGVHDGQTYEQVLEDRLNQEQAAGPGRRVEILNFSCLGYGSVRKLATLQQKALAFQLDAAFLTAMSNDEEWSGCDVIMGVQSGYPIPYEPINELAARAGLRYDLTGPISKLKIEPYGADIVRWSYGQFAAVCRQHRIKPYLVLLPKLVEINSQERQHLDALAATARDHQITVLDISDTYAGVKRLETFWIAPWDQHPSAEAHRLLADHLYELIRKGPGSGLFEPSPGAAPAQATSPASQTGESGS